MRQSALMLLPYLALAASCGGGGSEEALNPANGAPQQTQNSTLPGEADIIGKVYDPDYSVPDDFFVDERAGTPRSYTIHHVMDESGAFELCSDDFAIAEVWEAADNAARRVNGVYVGAYENERYFEFIRELSYDGDVGNVGDPTSPGFARVFKCGNTNRNGVDRSLLSGYAGTLNVRPLSQQLVRDFAEYFWQFTFFNARHRKVLDSHPSPASSGYAQTLLLAFASSQGSDRCDLIEVAEWRFTADYTSGEVASRFALIQSFEAEVVDGSPQRCQ